MNKKLKVAIRVFDNIACKYPDSLYVTTNLLQSKSGFTILVDSHNNNVVTCCNNYDDLLHLSFTLKISILLEAYI